MVRNLCVALLVLMGVIPIGVTGPAGDATGAEAAPPAAPIAAVNAERRAGGRGHLVADQRLACAAEARARMRDGRYIWVLAVTEEQPEVPGNPMILSNCDAKTG